MNRAIYSSPPENKTHLINEASPILSEKTDVYDLISAGPRKRFTVLSDCGPLIVHNCTLALGYQGGGNAFIKMAKQYGVEMTFEFGDEIKYNWRETNPEIVQLWYNLENGWRDAVTYPGKTYKVSKVLFRVEGDFMLIRLPSGRRISYYKPQSHDGCSYMGIDTYTRQWKRVETYGGRLLQNLCEGIGRDCMAHGMMKLEKSGTYPILGTVHDEVITEPLEDEGSLEEGIAMMCDKPAWAEGLPVAATGFRAKRYKKD